MTKKSLNKPKTSKFEYLGAICLVNIFVVFPVFNITSEGIYIMFGFLFIVFFIAALVSYKLRGVKINKREPCIYFDFECYNKPQNIYYNHKRN